ncbi:MAG: DUF1573 domain-containing protein, partial [Planctomycetota bacterium]
MKRAFILLFTSVFVGSLIAAWLHHNRYGYRKAFLGPFDESGEVTIASLDANPDQLDEIYRSAAKMTILGSDTYDFGKMRPGESGSAIFKFRNVGTETLEVSVGSTTCKCTA